MVLIAYFLHSKFWKNWTYRNRNIFFALFYTHTKFNLSPWNLKSVGAKCDLVQETRRLIKVLEESFLQKPMSFSRAPRRKRAVTLGDDSDRASRLQASPLLWSWTRAAWARWTWLIPERREYYIFSSLCFVIWLTPGFHKT